MREVVFWRRESRSLGRQVVFLGRRVVFCKGKRYAGEQMSRCGE